MWQLTTLRFGVARVLQPSTAAPELTRSAKMRESTIRQHAGLLYVVLTAGVAVQGLACKKEAPQATAVQSQFWLNLRSSAGGGKMTFLLRAHSVAFSSGDAAYDCLGKGCKGTASSSSVAGVQKTFAQNFRKNMCRPLKGDMDLTENVCAGA